MSSVSSAVQQVLHAQQNSQNQALQLAIVKKGLDAQRQTGDAMNEMIAQLAKAQKQISQGYLNVKV